ncbi:ABC transporter permease [Thiorhodovibrio frisius]|uniref:ABC-type dipeptide/oligopeptide/nickel transport system, permease component n=1 Tax=Thiorhodovibrio frisius TaxID=631362 RepID=H8Z493_9GAMM|nr:ABC-type dipeptide/oligopeptide/nickel transport system, permease component [Thiorhodovibrio frisius]WPL20887.1 Glutathione transport system permease protein GsiD [Thiorhodovibrio frisius]
MVTEGIIDTGTSRVGSSRDPLLVLAIAILALWLLAAIFAPWLGLSPNQIDLPRILAPPDASLWLGADDLGRPVLDRVLMGARTALAVGLGVVVVSALIGSLIGGFAALAGGLWDLLIVRLIDIFLAFPGILLAIALAGILGPGLGNLVIALASVGWVGYARLARAQVLSLRSREHVLAARALGVGDGRILLRHLLPLAAAPLLVEATFGVAAAVISEAGLSFLGLGVQPPAASWGSMIRDGVGALLVAPHLVLAPGIALLLVVLAINRVGDAWRDRLDVRGRVV